MTLLFNCLTYLDNHSFSIIEIAIKDEVRFPDEYRYHWIMVRKSDLKVFPMEIKGKNDEGREEERFFDMGYLRFDSQQGIFLESKTNALHPVEVEPCEGIDKVHLTAINAFLQMQYVNPSQD